MWGQVWKWTFRLGSTQSGVLDRVWKGGGVWVFSSEMSLMKSAGGSISLMSPSSGTRSSNPARTSPYEQCDQELLQHALFKVQLMERQSLAESKDATNVLDAAPAAADAAGVFGAVQEFTLVAIRREHKSEQEDIKKTAEMF